MKEAVQVVLSGLGGYGEVYLEALLSGAAGAPPLRLAAVAEPGPVRPALRSDLERRGVSFHPSLEAFYRAGGRADLVVIAAPPQFHCDQARLALARGAHVLCEKPAAVTPEEVDRMIEARDRAGRFAAVGFQWCFAPSVRALKGEILSGRLGRPLRMKGLCLWPRSRAYYRRNGWAGRLRDAEGRLVLDGPVMNAMAHLLHLLLFLAGPARGLSDGPAEVTAELYRANPIENHDTAALRARTRSGAELLFFASHAVRRDRGPCFHVEFERGEVSWPGGAAPVEVRPAGGGARTLPAPSSEPEMEKLRACVVAAARGGGAVPCSLEAARPHLETVHAAHASAGGIRPFPRERIREEAVGGGDRLLWVEGLEEALLSCYRAWALPSEQGIPWAEAGRTVRA